MLGLAKSRSFHLRAFLCLIFIILLQPSYTTAQDDDEGEEQTGAKSCHQYTFGLLTLTLKATIQCFAEFKPRNLMDYVSRSWCIIKCIMIKIGTLDEKGALNEVSVALLFEEQFDPIIAGPIIDGVQSCLVHVDKMDNNDWWCTSYEPLVSCILKLIVDNLIPYIGRCYINPIVAIGLDILKNITPNPQIQTSIENEQRRMRTPPRYRCFNKECSQKYEIRKSNGTSTFILYDAKNNMTEIMRRQRTPLKL